MKRIFGAALVAAFAFVGSAALAQTKERTETTQKYEGPGKNTKMKSETVTGTVKTYNAGKKITVTGPKDKDFSFDLDQDVKVEGSVAPGQIVTVEYMKDVDGKEHVIVLSKGKARALESRSHEHSAAKPAESSVPAGGSMHMESTTKHKGPGPNTKVKTETVVGKVKEYEAGKKIVVTGPKNKDYSFDLDENVAMKGSVNAGDRVKVTFTKSDNGNKVTTIAPYTASKSKKTAKAA